MADKKSRELVMAKLYFKNKDYKMAERSFNEYLDMNPEDVNALKLLAQVYEQNRRFDKAFEMYERCYLAEPERTGVLLDICRILLMNEIWLEHVDYRKWLNLAIKAFPSNPIVVNFKAFLATLPPEDQYNHHRESSRKTKASGEDPLLEILTTLRSINQRIEKIEDKLNNLDISKPEAAPVVAPMAAPVAKPVAAPIAAPVAKPVAAPPAAAAAPAPVVTPVVTPVATPVATPVVTPVAKPVAKPLGTTLVSPLGTTLATPLGTTLGTTFGTTLGTTLGTPLGATFGTTLGATFGTTLGTTLPTTLATTAPAPIEQPFSTNFFAESIKKLNLPLEGFSFGGQSTSGFKNDEEADKEEVVQNEELPIENTCDMTPIEIKTGEEDEDTLFEHRCKLFRFKDKEYKERGLGSLKVLKHRTTGKGRLIMRREAIGLVCLNCWDCSKIERVKDTQVRWAGVDASDGEAEMTVFLVKFKTPELTETFLNHLDDLFSMNTSISSPASKDNVSSYLAKEKPDVELIDPKLDQSLVEKARKLQLPDLFYHKLKNQEPCSGCEGCEKDE